MHVKLKSTIISWTASKNLRPFHAPAICILHTLHLQWTRVRSSLGSLRMVAVTSVEVRSITVRARFMNYLVTIGTFWCFCAFAQQSVMAGAPVASNLRR